MKKFLFTTFMSNDLGLLTRSLPIARELRDRGHQVAFCNPATTPSRLISEAGFDNLPFQLDVGILRSGMKRMKQSSTAETWNIDQWMHRVMWNPDAVRADVNALMHLIHDYEPDAVVDFWNGSACIAARASRKPLITVIQADVHPQSRGFIWWKEPPPDLPTPVETINTILAELQLEPIRTTGELFVGDLTLVVGMPETDPLPEMAHVTYIGPILWQRPEEVLPEWVADLSTTKPVIWLYSGNPRYIPTAETPVDSAVVIYACIEALKDTDVQVVMSTAYHSVPEDALPLPSNFRHVLFVPGLAMAQRSDLLIHHGGYGSCQTGLFVGTPALVIPTTSERESNARRVAAVGAGDFVLPKTDASGTKKQVNAVEVRDKVDQILSDSSYKENAKRIGEKLRSYGGAPYAARLIDEAV